MSTHKMKQAHAKLSESLQTLGAAINEPSEFAEAGRATPVREHVSDFLDEFDRIFCDEPTEQTRLAAATA